VAVRDVEVSVDVGDVEWDLTHGVSSVYHDDDVVLVTQGDQLFDGKNG